MAGKKGCKRRKFPSMDTYDPRFQINMRIRKIGEIQKDVDDLQRGYLQKIQELKDTLAEYCEPGNMLINELLFEVFAIAKKHRRELGKGKWKNLIRFKAGIIGWRLTPYGTTIHNAKKIIRWMEANGFGKYIRRVPEIDRQLLVRDRVKIQKKIPGVSIGRKEEFGVEPDMTKIRVALSTERLERLAKKAAKKKV